MSALTGFPVEKAAAQGSVRASTRAANGTHEAPLFCARHQWSSPTPELPAGCERRQGAGPSHVPETTGATCQNHVIKLEPRSHEGRPAMNASSRSSVGEPMARQARAGDSARPHPRLDEIAKERSDPSAQAPMAPIDFLRGHPAFRPLSANVLEQIRSYAIRKRVPRGTMIFAKGDSGSGLMAVLEGSVRISVPTLNGHEIVLSQVSRGQVFGEMAVIDGLPRSANATAVENCELMVIDRRNFLPVMHGHPEVAIKLLELLSARLRQSNEQVEDVMFAGLPVRLARALLKLAGTAECGDRPVRLAITQRELSQMVGVSRESTNKQLRAWHKGGWIRLDHAAITVLNARALSRIREER
jgi:CRP/FNR family transcriptional regulator, cyclic AMP receptor protein